MFKKQWLIILGVFFLSMMLVVSLMLVLPVRAQTITNLVANGDFEDADLSVWTVGAYGILSRTTSEVFAGSYSGQLTLSDTQEGSYDGDIYQCIDLSSVLPTWPTHSDGNKYLTATGWFNRYPESQAEVWMLLQFWETTTCSPPFISGTTSPGVTSSNWTQDMATLQIPANTQSIRLWVQATSPDQGPVYMDNIEIFSSNPTAVSLQQLEAKPATPTMEILITVLVVVGVALVLNRRRGKLRSDA